MIKHPSKACVPTRVFFFFLAVICVSQSAEVFNQNSRISIFYYSVVSKEFLVCFAFKLYYYKHLLEGIMWFQNVQMIGNRGRKRHFLSGLDETCQKSSLSL